MAAVNHWSDWFATTQPTAQSDVPTPQLKAPWGVNNRHYKRASIVLDNGNFDANAVARLMTFKSSDRISELWVCASGGTAIAGNIGLYLSGSAHDGADADQNLFCDAFALAGTVARADRFIEGGGATVDTDRGQAIWELLGLSSDPGVEYDLAITCTTTLTAGDALVTVEATGSFS